MNKSYSVNEVGGMNSEWSNRMYYDVMNGFSKKS